MSSSKIIKSLDTISDDLTEFSFKPISQLVISAPGDASAGFTPMAPSAETTGFVPMGLFDASDSKAESRAEEEIHQEPPGITLSEEELDQRLRESFQSGLQEGKNLTERGLLNVFSSLRSAVENLHVLREKILRESEDELIKLVMLVAAKVIQREVTQDDQILLNVVRAATAGISAHDEIIIYLHPSDYAMVTTGHADYFRQELFADKMQLKADPAVSSGSCRVATEMGTIDASFDSQMDEIFRRLQEERSMTSGNGA